MDLALSELGHLYEELSPEERDGLLQCLLIAASVGGDTVIERPEEISQGSASIGPPNQCQERRTHG